jgi:nicotinamidase/pyrazinamidase
MEMHADSALVLVDIQCDYLPDGAVAIPRGQEVVEPANRMAKGFADRGLPVILTRVWHPAHHMSFKEQGGKSPRHCVQDTHGAEFAADLEVPEAAWIISKGTEPEAQAVSGFTATDLGARLKESGIRSLYVAGLATEQAVKQTVLDAREAGFEVFLVANACRGINQHASDSASAVEEMMKKGTRIVSSGAVEDALQAFVAS